jgi:hypothetical protein
VQDKILDLYSAEFDAIREEEFNATNKLIRLKKKVVGLLAAEYEAAAGYTTELQERFGFILYEGKNSVDANWLISVSTNIRDDDGKFIVRLEQDRSSALAYTAICSVPWTKVQYLINDLLLITR